MKILIPILEFGKAGGYRVLSNLANEWIKMGHTVDFLSTIASIKPYFPTHATIYWVDKNGNFCKEQDLLKVRAYRFWDRWKALFLGMKNLTNDYDVILANQSLTAYPVAFSKIKGKKFYYIQAYEPEYGRLNGSFGHKVLSIFAWNSYNLNLIKIVNSFLYIKYKNISTNMVVLPGLDLKIFHNKSSNLFNDKIRIGCIGRMETYKGTKYVLDAFNVLKKRKSNVELHIAFGDRELENIYESIRVVVPENDQELAAFYRSMDIVIAPGTVQLGAVHYPVIESMASGTPIITTGYYPADDTNAWLVSVKNVEAIVKQIVNIIDQPKLREQKTKQALQDIQQFKWEIVAAKMYHYFLS